MVLQVRFALLAFAFVVPRLLTLDFAPLARSVPVTSLKDPGNEGPARVPGPHLRA